MKPNFNNHDTSFDYDNATYGTHWVHYRNGNYNVHFNTKDGTKIRDNDGDNLTPSFAESMDITITHHCDGGCEFCYAGCTVNGQHADLLHSKFFDTLHPYTEIAINGNDLTHPDLYWFLVKMKEKHVIVNMTVNQRHFMKHLLKLYQFVQMDLIHGLGISIVSGAITKEFIEAVQDFPNAIIHAIYGIVTVKDWNKLANHHLKILLLGYKTVGRGVEYYDNNQEEVRSRQEEIRQVLMNNWSGFDIISFDNLALKQINAKEIIPASTYDEIYMGDDGQYSFYIDAVNGTFATSSTSTVTYPIMDSVDDMFNFVRRIKS